MSFLFPGKSQLDTEIEKATSELLPYGQEDVALNFEICDQIRGKQVGAKEAMRGLKRRLEHKNPNVQMLALKLTDTCVKNGGHHFLVEIASKEFVDAMLANVRSEVTPTQVKSQVLEYLQNWALAFKSKPDLMYMYDTYMSLKNEGIWQFPASSGDHLGGKAIAIETAAPPEWTDSDVCERCRTAFTFTNRKHHCRACGRTFCQSCSSKNMALPALGIKDEVRVCDGCYGKKGLPAATGGGAPASAATAFPGSAVSGQTSSAADMALMRREQEELEKALKLSLAQSQSSYQRSRTPPPAQQPTKRRDSADNDAELAAAIAASLAEAKISEQRRASTAATTGAAKDYGYGYSNAYSNYSYSSAKQPETDSASLVSRIGSTYGESVASPPMPATTGAKNPNELSATEMENIELFAQLVTRLEQESQQNPHATEMLRNKEIQSLYQQISSLHPTLLNGLHDAITKHRQFLDLHTKIGEVTKQYNAVLEARLDYVKSGGGSSSGGYYGAAPPASTYPTLGAGQPSYGQPPGGYYGAAQPPTTYPPAHAHSPPPAFTQQQPPAAGYYSQPVAEHPTGSVPHPQPSAEPYYQGQPQAPPPSHYVPSAYQPQPPASQQMPPPASQPTYTYGTTPAYAPYSGAPVQPQPTGAYVPPPANAMYQPPPLQQQQAPQQAPAAPQPTAEEAPPLIEL
ncbi:Vacuolar protein-sorting-associated protein 27 [Sorochytrium milnesiophthora]